MTLTAILSSVAALATYGAATAIARRADPCYAGGTPSWAPIQVVGGQGGDYFCETHWGSDHAPVVGIEIWRTGTSAGGHIGGIAFQYAKNPGQDEWSKTYGIEDTRDYDVKSECKLSMDAGETITNVQLYGNGKGQKLGHIVIETSDNKKIDCGGDIGNIKPYSVDVGSGMLMGATGATTTDDDDTYVVNLGLLFLDQQIDHIEVRNVKYDTSELENKGKVQATQVDVASFYNDLKKEVKASQSHTFTVSDEKTFTQASTDTFGLSHNIEASFEILGLGGKTNTEMSWEHQTQTTSSVKSGGTTSVKCEFPSTPVEPGKGVKVTGSFWNSTADIPYSADVIVHMTDKTTYKYSESGRTKQSTFTQCMLRVGEDNDPDLEKDAEITGA